MQVRKAAYQSLGPFITTFKEEEGESAEGTQMSSLELQNSNSDAKLGADCTMSDEGERCGPQQARDNGPHADSSEPLCCDENATLESSVTWIEKQLKVVSLSECAGGREPDEGGRCEATEYNDVMFWRQPLPDIDLNLLSGSSTHLLSTKEAEIRNGRSGEEEEKEKVVVEVHMEENGEKETDGMEEEDKKQVVREETSKDPLSLEKKEVMEEKFVVHFEDDVISDSADRACPTAVHNLIRTSSHEVLLHSTPAPHNNLVASSSDMELTIQMDHSSQQPLPVSWEEGSVARLLWCYVFGCPL